MSEAKHTIGPWRAWKDLIYATCRDGRDHPIASADSPYVHDAEANALLIASSPDLLDALKNFTEGRDISYTEALVIARTAIAKAEPRS